MATNLVAPIFSKTVDLTAGRRQEVFPDPLNTDDSNQLDESNVYVLSAEKAFITELTIENGEGNVVDLTGFTVLNMEVAAEEDATSSPLLLSSLTIPDTVDIVDAVNGVVRFTCPTGALDRYYATDFDSIPDGAIRISWTLEDTFGNQVQFHDNVNVGDNEYSGTGSNPPTGLNVVVTAPSTAQTIESTADVTGLRVVANATQTEEVVEFLADGSVDGVTVKASGELSGTVDPTDGDGIGNRDYNDARYAPISVESLPVDDTTSIAQGNLDNTKQVRFDVETNVATATTRVLTVPDADVDLGDIATNNAKVSNATHTGDVTGSTALTIDPSAITGKSLVTGAAGDMVLITDASDSDNLKRVDLSDLLGGGGSLNDLTDVNIPTVAQGDILYRNATEWVKLGAGVNGQFLQTQGAGADPMWSSPSGSGDVVGPASAVNDNIALFDGATGKLIKDGGETLANVKDRANHTGTQTAATISDFDTEVSNNTDVTANTAKVSNATHTGDVTGSTALTIDPSAITGKSLVTAATGDTVLIADASDSNNLKKVDVNDFLSGGGLPTGRVTLSASTGTVDVDWSQGDTFILPTAAMTGNMTLTFSNVSQGQDITIDITGDSGYTLGIPASCDVALEGTSFTADVRNLIHIKSLDGATSQEVVYNLDAASGAVSADELNNLIIDGQFNHWDEGTSFTSSGYTATMWRGGTAAVTSPTFDQRSFTLGQTDVPDSPKYYMEFGAASMDAAASSNNLHQKVKDVTKLSGKTVTFSFWAKGSVSGSIAVRSRQDFGTGGSPSSAVNIEGELVSITTSWAKYTVQITFPSVSGKTLGTNNDDYYMVIIERYLGTNYTGFYPSDINPTYSGTLSIANVALVEGTTAFAEGSAWPTAEQERERILPFFWYEPNLTQDAFVVNASSSTVSRRTIVPFSTEMVNVPAFSIDSDNGNYTTSPTFAVIKNHARSATGATSSVSACSITGPKADARL